MTAAIVTLFIIGTILFLFTLGKQFTIVTKSPESDPFIRGKVLFFVFNICIVICVTGLLFACLTNNKQVLIPSGVFYIASALISVWAYYSHPKK